MQTENIVKYLQTAYSDEKLAALLAHAQDGKLGYGSCCCLIGIPTADHALQEAPGINILVARGVDARHYNRAQEQLGCPYGFYAEFEFKQLGKTDAERMAAIIPLIEAEISRRESLRHSPEFMEIIEAICE